MGGNHGWVLAPAYCLAESKYLVRSRMAEPTRTLVWVYAEVFADVWIANTGWSYFSRRLRSGRAELQVK